jgi:hypothetical protein
MKRFNSQAQVPKLPPITGAKFCVLAMDLAIAYANICFIEQGLLSEDVPERERRVAHRASMAIIEHAAGELVGILTEEI